MILHFSVLSLLAGSIIITVLILYSALLGVRILLNWDLASCSENQLTLERQTYLISTITKYGLCFEIFFAFLYIYIVDDLHVTFVGAMCATGSLNANPVGWWVLVVKITVIACAFLWLALNSLDEKVEDYPLVKIKYTFLLFLAPLVIGETWLQFRYFVDLSPDIITSCCGSLFSSDNESVAGSLAGLPIRSTMIVFYSFVTLFFLCLLLSTRIRFLRYANIFLSIFFAVISFSAIISFVSLYYYELPTHHCPFDLLQKTNYYIGYPLYISLFGTVLFSLMPGITEFLQKFPSLVEFLPKARQKWTAWSLFMLIIFVLLCSWPIIFSDFTLKGYL